MLARAAVRREWTTSALVALPSPGMGMAPRYSLGEHHSGIDFLRAGVLLEQVSRHNRCLQHGLGHYMQRAGSLGSLEGASTALANQLPRAAGSASSLEAVPATAVSQACVGPYGCLIHQLAGRSTIMPHVTVHLPSPPLESYTAQIAARCPHSGGAQSCSRCFLMTAHVPQRVATPSRDDSAYLESIRESSGRPICFPRVFPLPAVFVLWRHWHTGTQLALRKYAFPPMSLLAQTARSRRTRSRSCWSRHSDRPGLAFRTHFPRNSPSLAHERTSFLRGSAPYGTRVQICATFICGSWMGRGRLEWSSTGCGRDHHSD